MYSLKLFIPINLTITHFTNLFHLHKLISLNIKHMRDIHYFSLISYECT